METILIQDDDEAIAEIVITALSMEGYRACRLAGDEENIMEMIRSHHAKLIVLDCWLGKQSVKLCSWIKAHFPGVRVIAFSCDNQAGENFRDLGFDGYLGKPFDLQELYGTVRQFIPVRRKRQPAEQQLEC
jgi:DNA-binding response OmpR family regulator